MDNYTITVEFTRKHSDDDDMAIHRYGNASNENLIKQFMNELREACDDGIVGGQFKIVAIDIPAGSDHARETD